MFSDSFYCVICAFSLFLLSLFLLSLFLRLSHKNATLPSFALSRAAQEVPFLDVDADNEKDAAAARKEIADLLDKEIRIWEAKIIERRKVLSRLERSTIDMKMKLTIYQHEKKSDSNTWMCEFGTGTKAKLASKLCRKTDWSDYKLAVLKKGFMGEADSPPLILYGRRSEFPLEYEDDQRVVNMRLVRICRRRHGQGGYVQEDLNEMRITPNWFYRGEFQFGKRHGLGVNHTYCATYTGHFDGDIERDLTGNATFDYADGSKWTGDVGVQLQHSLSLLNGNEYARVRSYRV